MDRIKESFDSLPTAVCFFNAQGIIRLINHKMLSVLTFFHKNGLQTLAELDEVLQNPPADITCLNPHLQLYQFPDGRILRFQKKSIQTKEGAFYTELTAADVTELIRKQNQLQEENAKLEEANERMRKLFEQMPAIIREEETLEMKLRVHDDIGHSILAARRALLRQANLEELQASAALWEQSIAVLYHSNQIHTEADPWEEAIKRADDMGLRILLTGDPPQARTKRFARETLAPSAVACDIFSFCESAHPCGAFSYYTRNRSLAALALRECAANAVRHAAATELYANFKDMKNQIELQLTNNGSLPAEEICEGGGLSMLRQRLEEAGGQMTIQSQPCFMLRIILPKEEN